MDKIVIAALLGAIGGLLSSGILLWTTLKGKKLDRATEQEKLWVNAYDAKLLEHRLVGYRPLWKLTGHASRQRIHSLGEDVTPQAFEELLTEWYYDNGMLLTATSRQAFFAARDTLSSRKKDLSQESLSIIVKAFSSLRTSMCEDLNSRKGPTLSSQMDPDWLEAKAAEVYACMPDFSRRGR